MFKWYGKDRSRFWHWLARMLPWRLTYWCILVASAEYLSKYNHLTPDEVRVMPLIHFLDKQKIGC